MQSKTQLIAVALSAISLATAIQPASAREGERDGRIVVAQRGPSEDGEDQKRRGKGERRREPPPQAQSPSQPPPQPPAQPPAAIQQQQIQQLQQRQADEQRRQMERAQRQQERAAEQQRRAAEREQQRQIRQQQIQQRQLERAREQQQRTQEQQQRAQEQQQRIQEQQRRAAEQSREQQLRAAERAREAEQQAREAQQRAIEQQRRAADQQRRTLQQRDERREEQVERRIERRDDRLETRDDRLERRQDRLERRDDRIDTARDRIQIDRGRLEEWRQRNRAQPERTLRDVVKLRRERREGDRVIIEEPGDLRIIREAGRLFVRGGDRERFRWRTRDFREERRGSNLFRTYYRQDGIQIINVYDDNGRLLRRLKRLANGREIVLIDNRRRIRPRAYRRFDQPWFWLNLALPRITISRDLYVVDASYASYDDIYDALTAPPLVPIERSYSLDEVLYNYPLRARMRSVDVDTIYFDFDSWELAAEEVDKLEVIARALLRAIEENPDDVYLVEGHTDAPGSDDYNLSLSQRRADEVAQVLTEVFAVPPENLTTQGYGEEFLRIDTEDRERRNRRVTIRRIGPLLSSGR